MSVGLAARRIIRQLESAGIAVHPSCRLMEYARLLTHRGGRGPVADAWSRYELSQFDLIGRNLLDDPDTWRTRIEIATGEYPSPIAVHWDVAANIKPRDATGRIRDLGPPPPDPSTWNSRPRDLQFELFLAATYRAAGAAPCPREPPDLVVSGEFGELGIAAKRIRSIKQLRKRLKKGVSQLRRARQEGFVAMDVTIERDSLCRCAPTDAAAHQDLDGRLKALWQQHESSLRSYLERPPFPALLLYAAMPVDDIAGHESIANAWRWVLPRAAPAALRERLTSALNLLVEQPRRGAG